MYLQPSLGDEGKKKREREVAEHHIILVEIANVITNLEEIYNLGLLLGIKLDNIQRIQNRNPSLNQAAYEILCSFYESVPNNKVWGILIDALRSLRKNATVYELGLEELHFTPRWDEGALDKAYFEACREGTKKVYNARMILAGYSEAGKTALATRLLGKVMDIAKRESTEGISLHRSESRFNGKEMKCEVWTENGINPSDLIKYFSHEVWSRAKKKLGKDSSHKSNIDECGSIKVNGVNYVYHSEERKVNMNSYSLSEIRYSSNKETASEETRKQLMDNMRVTLDRESEESTPFTISVWDLGGQDEFISTHHLFLNTEAFILIVMDITKGLHQLIGRNFNLGYLNTPAEVLHYWLEFFHSEVEKGKKGLSIAIALTHTDLIQSNRDLYVSDYKGQIMEMIKDKPYSKYIRKDSIYAVSNTMDSDSDFQKLRDQLLKHLTQQESWGHDMPLTWLKLKADIINIANAIGEKHLHLDEVWKLSYELRMSTADVESFLQKQDAMGDFVYFSDPELRELVITEPKWLVDKCKALITSHEFIDQITELPQGIRDSLKKGEITEDGLKHLWNNDGVVFLIRLMKNYDLIVDVSDASERKYIIPCMLGSTKCHRHIPYKLLIGSFPQFVSKCSKEESWKLSRDHLSFTSASFDIGENVKLRLSLSLSGEVQETFDWPHEMGESQRDIIQRGTIKTLMRIMKTCRIQPINDEGDTQLTDGMLWNLSQKFHNESDIRTLALTGLKVEECKVSSSLTNYCRDINCAMYAVLRHWRDTQDNDRIAHKRLCEALRTVGKNILISQVLQPGK